MGGQKSKRKSKEAQCLDLTRTASGSRMTAPAPLASAGRHMTGPATTATVANGPTLSFAVLPVATGIVVGAMPSCPTICAPTHSIVARPTGRRLHGRGGNRGAYVNCDRVANIEVAIPLKAAHWASKKLVALCR